MKQAQKIIKYLAIGFGIFLTINIIGWIVFGVCSYRKHNGKKCRDDNI